jgi:hypothetical protein
MRSTRAVEASSLQAHHWQGWKTRDTEVSPASGMQRRGIRSLVACLMMVLHAIVVHGSKQVWSPPETHSHSPGSVTRVDGDFLHQVGSRGACQIIQKPVHERDISAIQAV